MRDGAAREWDAQGHLVIDETWAAGVLDGDRTIGTPKGIGRVVEHWTKGVRTGDRKISWKGHPRLVEHYDDDGKLDGKYTVYRGSGGGLRIEGAFAHGVRTGTWTWYANAGTPERQGKYKNGLQEGAWTKWKGDVVTATGTFKKGLPDGTFVLYDDQGTEVGRYTMKRGTGTMLDFHRKNRKARATEYVDGARDGADTGYSTKGAVIEQGAWDADVRDGDWRTVDADGSVVTAHWDHGVLDGAWQRTRADGSVALAVTYAHGLRDGDITETFPDGTPMLEGHYAADLPDGEWVTHAPDGTVALRATYAAGELLDRRAP
jgi:antitoxin component YwqK of YwqJK toxin-antitoxin module